MNKSFAVFGIGKFGESIAIELAHAGCDVLAVDTNKERVHDIAEYVTCAVQADISDPDAFNSLGISNMDAVIIAITGNLDASIMATILSKEAGVPYVIVKSNNDMHSKILEKVGADKVIVPEHETGVRIAHRLISGNVVDFFELSQRIRMVEINIRPEWIGKTLRELNPRKKYGINVIAVRQNNEININPDPDEALQEDVTLLITIDKKDMEKLF